MLLKVVLYLERIENCAGTVGICGLKEAEEEWEGKETLKRAIEMDSEHKENDHRNKDWGRKKKMKEDETERSKEEDRKNNKEPRKKREDKCRKMDQKGEEREGQKR